jgi:peptidyl-tRNA hydrolase
MPAGKLSAQAGHAYTNTLLLAQKNFPNLHEHYLTHKITGSKVTLKAKNTSHNHFFLKNIQRGFPNLTLEKIKEIIEIYTKENTD